MRSAAVDQNIDALSEAIMSEARAEADKIRAEAQARADEIRKKAEEQAQQIRKEALDRANQEAQRIRGQVVATTQMKARTNQLDKREALLNQVFDEARKELPNIEKWSDYDDTARILLNEALTQLRAKSVIIRADPRTAQVITPQLLEEVSKQRGVELRMGDPLEKGTGVVLETTDKHLQYDNTLQTRLQRMQNGLRSFVYHLLMGEAQ